MPEFPLIDAHVHLWDPTRYRIPWTDNVPVLNRPFELDAYHEQTRGVDIEAFVYVEVDIAPDYRLIEASLAERYAEADPRLRGIVASAPLEYGEQVRPFLDELVKVGPRLKGVRRLLQDETDPNYCLRPGFVRGVEMLADFGLSFDLCVYHPQMAGIVELVDRLPRVNFVLDHIGKPGIKDGLLDPWREHIAVLAAHPNVVCKVSGLVTEADQTGWTSADLAPYVSHVLASFGEDRVLFGSDWPVATRASSYVQWVETLDALTAHLSPAAKRKLWAENARRVYRLGA